MKQDTAQIEKQAAQAAQNHVETTEEPWDNWTCRQQHDLLRDDFQAVKTICFRHMSQAMNSPQTPENQATVNLWIKEDTRLDNYWLAIDPLNEKQIKDAQNLLKDIVEEKKPYDIEAMKPILDVYDHDGRQRPAKPNPEQNIEH